MADCPECGYALGPFDTTCPRCARNKPSASGSLQELEDLLATPQKELLSSPQKKTVSAKASRSRQTTLVVIASIAILVGLFFIINHFRQPGSSLWSNPLSTGTPPPINASPTAVAPTPIQEERGPALPLDELDVNPALIGCPFALTPGQSIGLRADASVTGITVYDVDSAADTVSQAVAGTWSIGGLDGAPLRLTIKPGLVETTGEAAEYTSESESFGDIRPGGQRTLDGDFAWQDQPFEVYNGETLVASFKNTADYSKARGK